MSQQAGNARGVYCPRPTLLLVLHNQAGTYVLSNYSTIVHTLCVLSHDAHGELTLHLLLLKIT